MHGVSRLALLLALVLLFTGSFALAGEAAAEGTPAEGLIRSWQKKEGWQYLRLGQYMYEKDGTIAPVLWRVLYVENGKALMITEYVIDLCQPYYMDTKKDYDFYKEYKHKSRLPELNSIAETEVPGWFANVMWPVLIGEDPIGAAFVDEGEGRLFLMPTSEWCRTEYGFTKKKGDAPNPSRIAQVTPYVRYKKMYDWSSRMVLYEKGYTGSCYWTSDMRPGERRMQIVGINGHLSWGGWIRPNVGVRPAAKLDLTQLRVDSGSGTAKDPYVVSFSGE